jgi:hypothetical protein
VIVDVAYTIIDPRVRAHDRREPAPDSGARPADARRPAVSSSA